MKNRDGCLMHGQKSGYLPVDKEMKNHCFHCASGMGVAGNGVCFLNGDPEADTCEQFISEDEFLKNMKKELEQ